MKINCCIRLRLRRASFLSRCLKLRAHIAAEHKSVISLAAISAAFQRPAEIAFRSPVRSATLSLALLTVFTLCRLTGFGIASLAQLSTFSASSHRHFACGIPVGWCCWRRWLLCCCALLVRSITCKNVRRAARTHTHPATRPTVGRRPPCSISLLRKFDPFSSDAVGVCVSAYACDSVCSR